MRVREMERAAVAAAAAAKILTLGRRQCGGGDAAGAGEDLLRREARWVGVSNT
jgi:hypothetical protein